MISTLPGIDFFRDGVGGNTVASVKCNLPGRVRGQRSSVGSVLWLPLEAPGDSAAKVMMLHGVLKLPNQNEGITIPMQTYMNSTLRIPVTDEQFARIETYRQGGPISFELWLTGLGTLNGETIILATNTQGVPLQVPREDWLRVLGECGYGTRRLIELPPIPTRDQQSWGDAVARIQGAANRLASGDTGGAMTQGRIALERIVESIGEVIGRPRTTNDKALKNYIQSVRAELEKKHRPLSSDPYQVLADSMQVATSASEFASDPPHNDLDTAERVHAELTLAIVTTLYCYCAQAIGEGST